MGLVLWPEGVFFDTMSKDNAWASLVLHSLNSKGSYYGPGFPFPLWENRQRRAASLAWCGTRNRCNIVAGGGTDEVHRRHLGGSEGSHRKGRDVLLIFAVCPFFHVSVS